MEACLYGGMMTKNYFITGGAGFIGSNYVNRLLERGEKVTIFDNLSRAGAAAQPGLVEGKVWRNRLLDYGGGCAQRRFGEGIRPRGGCDRPPGGTGGSHHLGDQSTGGFRDQCPGDLQRAGGCPPERAQTGLPVRLHQQSIWRHGGRKGGGRCHPLALCRPATGMPGNTAAGFPQPVWLQQRHGRSICPGLCKDL